MAMDAGSAIVGGGGSGLAQAMADAILSTLGDLGIPPASVTAEQQVDDLANALAAAIVDHITDNADVSTTVASGIAVATTGTAAAQTGTTTATGAGTGSVT